jgi:23S rRNA (cytosine1962-C5)-methyltransferase
MSESPATTVAPTGALVLISRRAADRLRAGHLWVYRSDIAEEIPSAAGSIAPGELVSVADPRGAPLGTALYSSTSLITLRLISPTPELTREAYLALVRDRLLRAIALRDDLLAQSPDTDACRLVFSEADNLPGIIADRYANLVILQLLTQGTALDDIRRVFTDTIRSAPSLKSVTTLIERPDPRIRELEQLPAPSSAPLYSATPKSPVTTTIFHLNGLSFHYDADAGQKTGAFLDQRENYAAAARYARGRALDICTYQGGFALHLARVCSHVTAVDLSRPALEVAERNQELNRAQLSANIGWIVANAFDYLRDQESLGEHFDTIVLDPPAFAKTKRAADNALRGYKELNLRALKMLSPGGTLVTCSCSHHVPLADFANIVAAAASDAGRRVRLLEVRGAAPDHPAILTLPETSYLKCLICKVDN